MNSSKMQLYSIISLPLCYFSFSQTKVTTLILPSLAKGAGRVTYLIRSPSRWTSRMFVVLVQTSFQEIEMVHNLATVVSIGAAIGRHHSMKIGALLIRHLLNEFRLGPPIIGDKNDEMTILPVHG